MIAFRYSGGESAGRLRPAQVAQTLPCFVRAGRVGGQLDNRDLFELAKVLSKSVRAFIMARRAI